MNPAALALALLLGHEARINDEQWSEVKAMDEKLCAYCKTATAPYWANVCHPCSIEIERQMRARHTPPPCPACEAAARERDAAKAETVDARKRYRTIRDKADSLNALCENQATILSRVAVVLRGPEPQQARWSHHDLPERAAEAVAQRDAAYEDARQMQERLQRLIDAEPQQELADLRARLAKASRLLDQVAEFQAFTMPEFEQARELLREKEAK